ncbi:MAG TPA: ATPase, T2SS/T4P/T4SS family [Phycisphaerales bacterium]|nr:ATPase, T2SS/T4P/T4SS family [Phycisphaerales bacterium]
MLATTPQLLTLAQAAEPTYALVSWWKALLLLLPFVPWAWYVSRVFDKHAAKWLLPRETFNLIHLCVGLGAILLAVFMPVEGDAAFWAGWGAMIVLLAADIGVFLHIHNKDERVPDKFKLSLVDFSKLREASEAKKSAKLQGRSELVIKRPDKSLVPVPEADSPEFALRIGAEEWYVKAGAARASRVEVGPSGKENVYSVRLIVDGVPNAGESLPAADAMKLIDFWKGAAGLDLNERRKRQQGEVTVERGSLKRKVRVGTLGTQAGVRMTMLFDPETAVKREIGELGLLDQQKADVDALIKSEGGVVLLCTPAMAGRTTTFYTFMRMHDAYTRNVQTIEMDPQMTLEGIRTTKYEPTADGPEYSTAVRSILRRDPDVLGVAELPDAQTAKEIAKADMTRVRIYACVRADNALAALQGWSKLVADPELASKSLRGVVAQRLLRKLCPNCKTPYQPNADTLKKLGLPADGVKQLFKKGGQVMVKDKVQTCSQCEGVGYFGQEGVFEVYVLTDGDRVLVKNQDWNGLKLEFRKRKLPNIQQAALRKAIDGVTSIEEVLRITTEAAPAPQAPAPAAPATPAAAKQ